MTMSQATGRVEGARGREQCQERAFLTRPRPHTDGGERVRGSTVEPGKCARVFLRRLSLCASIILDASVKVLLK